MHIAQIGTGHVRQPTTYTIMCSELVDTITVCDTKPLSQKPSPKSFGMEQQV